MNILLEDAWYSGSAVDMVALGKNKNYTIYILILHRETISIAEKQSNSLEDRNSKLRIHKNLLIRKRFPIFRHHFPNLSSS